MAVVEKERKSMWSKSDAINLLILISIASLLGVYLISTAVLISKDGVFYIERAQQFPSNPVGIIKAHPPGYPFLIFIAHKFAGLFSNSSSAQSWIYSAQSITLLCRLLALTALYFIGKILVGSRKSFWAVFILIILPYPARFGSDVLRDWPYILFLGAGFLSLLLGAKQSKWWMFGVTGLVAGFGHIVRPECVQLVIYGVLWLLIILFRPRCNMSRTKALCGLLALLAIFSICAFPYVKIRGRVLPAQLEEMLDFPRRVQPDKPAADSFDYSNNIYKAGSILGNTVKAIGELFKEVSENLMYFFMPVLLIGLYIRFQKKRLLTEPEGFFEVVFLLFNILMLILLHFDRGYISGRHCLALVILLAFYLPGGLEVLAALLEKKHPLNKQKESKPAGIRLNWFWILVFTGTVICLPKLLTPLRIEKQAYRAAAQWIKENSNSEDVVLSPDHRINFYAERKMGEFSGGDIPNDVKYIVKKFKRQEEVLSYGSKISHRFSLLKQWQSKNTVIAVYGLVN